MANQLVLPITVALLATGVAFGSPGVRIDRAVSPLPPAPLLPPAGGTFTDPTFGTTILRLTDPRDRKQNHVAYSTCGHELLPPSRRAPG